jgi:uncharacterized membrane protein
MQDRAAPIAAGRALARTALQTAAILLITLIAGVTFGIWRGYNPSGFSATTFLEVHHGAVRGLNTLLPIMGLLAILATIVLAWTARAKPGALRLYLIAIVPMVAAGLITRFGNQPINAMVMDWNVATMPETWTELRDRWWALHIARTFASIVAAALLINGVFADRASCNA